MDASFEVREMMRNEVRVLAVAGELDLGSCAAVREPLERAGKDLARTPLVIDLTACGFIDSTGLATLAHGTRPLRKRDIGVVLVCPEGEVRELLKLSALDLALPAYDSLEQAIAAASTDGDGSA